MDGAKWIKIIPTIFEDEKFDFIEEEFENRLLVELIWIKLLCLAGSCNNNGFLSKSESIKYTPEKISKKLRIDLPNILSALNLFEKYEMVEIVNGEYMISNWSMYQNEKGLAEIREKGRERQRRYRERQKAITEVKTTSIKSNTNLIEREYVDLESAWENTFAAYPKQSYAHSAKIAWMDLLLPVIDENKKDVATLIFKATKLYLKNYKKTHPNEDVEWKFLPKYETFLKEDCEHWMRLVDKEEKKND